MTTSISSEAQKNMIGTQTKILRAFGKIKNHETFLTYLLYFLICIFCCMTERLTDNVNYILNAHWYRESLQKKSSLITAEKNTFSPLRYGLTD